MEKKEPTIEQLQKELDGQKNTNELVAKEAMLNARIIKLLVATGLVTEDKVEEARALLRPLS